MITFVVMCFKLGCKKKLLCGGLRFVEARGLFQNLALYLQHTRHYILSNVNTTYLQIVGKGGTSTDY